MSLNYASPLHVLSQPISLFNSPRLDRRLDDDLITSARRADIRLLARPTHACTCYYKFPGNQGRGQPVWSWAAATPFPLNKKITDGRKQLYNQSELGLTHEQQHYTAIQLTIKQ